MPIKIERNCEVGELRCLLMKTDLTSYCKCCKEASTIIKAGFPPYEVLDMFVGEMLGDALKELQGLGRQHEPKTPFLRRFMGLGPEVEEETPYDESLIDHLLNQPGEEVELPGEMNSYRGVLLFSPEVQMEQSEADELNQRIDAAQQYIKDFNRWVADHPGKNPPRVMIERFEEDTKFVASHFRI